MIQNPQHYRTGLDHHFASYLTVVEKPVIRYSYDGCVPDLPTHKRNQTTILVSVANEQVDYEVLVTVAEYGEHAGEIESAVVVSKLVGDSEWDGTAPRAAWPSLIEWLRSDKQVAYVVRDVYGECMDSLAEALRTP
jgi:hypothetical protein